MRLKRQEREKIINFNEAEEAANVYTYNQKLIHKLEAIDRPECVLKRKGDMWAEYDVPKTWVKITPPRVLTAAQRVAAVHNLGRKHSV